MSVQSQMPWETLRAETLRAVLKDLEVKQYFSKKDEMVQFLHSVERNGVESDVGRPERTRHREPGAQAGPSRSRLVRPGKLIAYVEIQKRVPRHHHVAPNAIQVSPTYRAGRISARKQSFEGVVLPPSPTRRKRAKSGQFLIGVIMPSISNAIAGPSSSSRSDEDVGESASARISGKGKGRA
ncbi:uncharacterized protein LAESUDRAFT_816681 [Laetiporus sulphureus 93-53]|uniref:Uncharacterized protein n=1 Tax=Laetiporus sulphureus 93-53 TaxID=1314785 RepID=A0A165B2T8_9APHY|nr:uncharacterized protein LAESUDRAFT_816681 [Laetiporus sulphureus 93-53]KZT00114.1 hypothetical protein LAESUDRAFT_816681 [Laetiporus sulphureus 93-53]